MSDINLKYKDQHYNRKRLLSLSDSQLASPYLLEIKKFLLDWWSPSDSIQSETSGSTGTPKTIDLQKSSMIKSAEATGKYFGLTDQTSEKLKICCPLPVKYIAGKMMLIRAIVWSAEITILEPDSDPLGELEERYDFIVMTPHQLFTGLENGNGTKAALVDKILLGGSPVTPRLEKTIESFRTKFYLGYGMTETMSHVAVRALNGNEKSMYYTAVPGIRFEIDKRGCLVIHTDGLLEGPLVTNDVVSLKSPTKFEWLGRYDHVVNSGGVKLFPEKIERKLEEIIPTPFYLKGMPDEKLGQKLTIVLETKNLEETDKQLWISQMEILLNKYEMPKLWQTMESFEKTGSGKIKRV